MERQQQWTRKGIRLPRAELAWSSTLDSGLRPGAPRSVQGPRWGCAAADRLVYVLSVLMCLNVHWCLVCWCAGRRVMLCSVLN